MGLADLPIAAVAVTAIAAGVSAYSSVKQSQATAKADNYNSQLASYNAAIDTQQGQQDAAEVESQGEIIQGKAKSAAAASGLAGGSSDDIAYADLVSNDQDALAAKYRGTISGYSSSAQAGLDSAAASNATQQGILGAGSALLSGAAKSYSASSGISTTSTVTPVFGSPTNSNAPTF